MEAVLICASASAAAAEASRGVGPVFVTCVICGVWLWVLVAYLTGEKLR
jgi:hypothetical protein